MNISADSVARAEVGRYKPHGVELTRPLDVDILGSLFDREGDDLVIKGALRQNIRWLVADAMDPGMASSLGLQDVVLANNFLIHMNDRQAAICMLNAARLGRPGGLFVCRGVAQPVREKVVQQLGFKPLACRIAEIHNADEKFAARKDWPWRYWALEPIDKSRKNWTTRYASMFQCAAALVILLTCSVIVAKERDSPTTGAVTPSEAPKLRGSRTERTLS